MTKKKAKGKTGAKSAKKTSSPRSKGKRNPAGVRDDIAKIVELAAKKITEAVMEQAMTGQLAPAKYLFEMAEIFPLSTDGSHATENEDCLARTLLNRMDIPDEPVAREDEDGRKVTPKEKAVVKAEEKTADETKAKKSGPESATGEKGADSAVV